MKEGRIIVQGTTDELIREMCGKVWSALIQERDLYRYEKIIRLVNIRNEGKDTVFIRYLAKSPVVQDSQPENPRLEDLYLWLFPQEETHGKEGM